MPVNDCASACRCQYDALEEPTTPWTGKHSDSILLMLSSVCSRETNRPHTVPDSIVASPVRIHQPLYYVHAISEQMRERDRVFPFCERGAHSVILWQFGQDCCDFCVGLLISTAQVDRVGQFQPVAADHAANTI